jgi:hypothetical protein
MLINTSECSSVKKESSVREECHDYKRKKKHTHTQAFHLHICFYDAIDQKAKQKKKLPFPLVLFPEKEYHFSCHLKKSKTSD